jgi:hypothetical protein
LSNVTLNPGTGGATLGTDTVSGIDYQKVKPVFGTDGTVPVSVDATHGLPVNIVAGSGGNAAAGAVGSPPPSSADQIGFTSGGNLTGVSAANPLPVTVSDFPAIQAVDGTVNVGNFPATQPVSGTVTANQGTSPWVDNLTQVAGTALGATAVTNFGTAPAAAAVPGVNASLFSGNTGITNTSGAVDVNLKTSSITVNENLLQVASTVLGTPQSFGTAPSGVVIGTSSDLYIAGTRARSNQTTTAAGVQDVNIVGNIGATNSVTNGLFASITDGTTKAGVIVATTALKTDLSSVAGTATVAASAGIQKVGISGATGVTLDGTAAAGTSPVNGLLTLAECVTTAPSLTTGQSAALQGAWDGSLFVKPYRRSNTKAATGSIASTTAATMLAAQASGVFADLAGLVLTVDPTTAVAGLSVNISDGTNTYKFWFDIGPIPSTTVAAVVPPVCINFDPPISATTAATAWTIALSVADATVFYVANFVLQKAS